MITVITGMEVHPFDRLLEAVDELVGSGGIRDEVFAQRGNTPYRPKHLVYEDFVSFGALCDRIRASDVIITHAGAGSTLTCLQCQRRPIVVPRQARYGEHVDDHQRPFAQRLHDFGLARQVVEMEELSAAIHAERGRGDFVRPASDPASGILGFLEALREELERRRA